jgi:hypothetical protein
MTAFLLTWKEEGKGGWPHENIVRLVHTLERDGFVDEPWRIAAYTKARAGDRAWLLKQGRGAKGIFGVGVITGPTALGLDGNGNTKQMAPVRFEALVDPKQRFLIGEDAVRRILEPAQLNARASGYPLQEPTTEALEKLLAAGETVELGGSGDWTPSELNAIVADYFAMLALELAGKSYSKTEHRNALRQVIKRSPGSIERKHENISSVLQQLGLPWIRGYKPLPNIQDSLVEAVEARLGVEIKHLDARPPKPPSSTIDPKSVFVAPPSAAPKPVANRAIARIVRKFDPATRDAANRRLGNAGESFVLDVERARLIAIGRADLAAKVAWVSKDVGDGLGYDIESFADNNGQPIFIEVKTTRGSIETSFFLSENERRVAVEKGSAFRLYRVFGFDSDPKVYTLTGPLDDVLALEPISYRAQVAPKLIS